MKRDMDLIRELLKYIEENSDDKPLRNSLWIDIGDHSNETINGHLAIMIDAGLVAGTIGGVGNPTTVHKVRLTWAGHEFLDEARDDQNWEKARDLMNKAGGFSIEIAKQVLQQIILEKLGIR